MQNVVRQGNIIYLHIQNEWYEYNESVAPVGAGAMGVVYLGKNSRSGQRVAIKMVREQYANNPEIRERAILEASFMFMHSNLIEMLGHCELHPHQGPIWIVSKFVQGITIDKFIQSQHYATTQRTAHIVRMFVPVLDALAYLHSKGICHLDIKPSNIMVESGRNVRVLDLGIANITNGFAEGSANGHDSHGYMGTPNYAAPEQFTHESQFSAETDIYEAGVSLYELLTGKNPFAARSLHETMEKHKTVCLPANENMPTELLKVLRKATAFQQSARYQSAQEFKQALLVALRHKESSVPIWAWVLLGLSAFMVIILILICYLQMR